MSRFRQFSAIIAVVLSLRLLMGCGSGGGGGAPGLTGRVEGWAFVQAGNIVLANGSAAPAGATALSGASISVEGRAGTVSTDAAGHFLVQDVPIGQRKMQVAPPAGGGAAALEVPLTVLLSATVPTGAFPVTRQQAIDLAKTALNGIGNAADFRLLAPQQPLPTGTVLAPALGNDFGEADPSLNYTVQMPQWLIYADGLPTERFQHPVSYILVNAQDGTVTVRQATSWPRINTLSMYADDDANEQAQDLVQSGTRKAVVSTSEDLTAEVKRAVTSARSGRDHVPGASNPKTYALFIQGNSRSDFEADMNNVKASLFGANGLSGPSVVKTWSPPESGTARAQTEVRALFDQICAEARPEDTVLIYITSHGSKSGAVYLQQGVESDESTTPDGAMFPYLDLDTSRCAACHVIVIIDACYAGEAMVEMDVKSPPHPGQKRTTIVSSTSSETSGGITRRINLQNGRPLGGVFTSAFLAALKSYSQANGGASQSNLKEIFDDAVVRMNSNKQHPQTVFRWDGKSCGAPPTLVKVTPDNVTATHTVGESPCPQTLPSVSIENVSGKTLTYSASLNSTYFSLSGLSGSLSVGEKKSLGLSFNCGNVPPLNASLSISASYQSEKQSVNVPITLKAGP